MGKAIKHGLANLANFWGRDGLSSFWLLVAFIYLVSFAISIVVMVPVMVNLFSTVIDSARAHPQDPQVIQAQMFGMMAQMIPGMLWLGVGLTLFKLVGLSAAFVRRLHDSDLPGWLAAIPVVLELIVLAGTPAQMAKMQQVFAKMPAMMDKLQHLPPGTNPNTVMPGMQGNMWLTLFSWLAIGIVIALGVRGSTPGPNRYGDAPVER